MDGSGLGIETGADVGIMSFVRGLIFALVRGIFPLAIRAAVRHFAPFQRTVLLPALFCFIARGLADGLFYLWERNSLLRQENRIVVLSRSPGERESALSLVREQLDDSILRWVPEEARVQINERLVGQLAETRDRESPTVRDAATILCGTFLRPTVAGLFGDLALAVNLSAPAGILLLFIVGYGRALERDTVSRIVNALGAALIGIIVATTIVLGG